MRTTLLTIAMTLGLAGTTFGQITLPWFEGFEGTSGETYLKDTNSVTGVPGASYTQTADGRLRTAVGSAFYHSGSASATLDAAQTASMSENNLIFTLDMTNYSSSTFELSFYFTHDGEESHSNDRVWVRGDTSDNWIEVYDWYANRPSQGTWKQAVIPMSKALNDSSQTITARTQIRFGQQDNYPANASVSDGLIIDDIEIVEIANDDGSIAAVPAGAYCANSVNVSVVIENLGADTMKSAVVNWTANGASQTTFNYTGNLARNERDTIQLGSLNISSPQSLVTWVDSVNGSVDAVRTNDTLRFDIIKGMSGTYTVGGTTPDYNTLSAALSDLRTTGLCGAIRFEVRQGTYTEQLDFSNIEGLSATNTLEVVADQSNTQDVIIESSTTTNNYVAYFENASYITLDSLHLKATAGDGRVVSMAGMNSHLSITNCTLEGLTTTSTSDASAVIFEESGSSNVTDTLLIENNTILNGSIGIDITGSTSNNEDRGLIVKNNTVTDWNYVGMYLSGQYQAEVSNNYVKDADTDDDPYGIYFYYCDELLASSNTVLVGGSDDSDGIRLYYCDGTSSNPVILKNNMVSMYGLNSDDVGGIYAYQGEYNRILNNSVSISFGGSGADALYFSYGSGDHAEMFNNSFSNYGSGYGLYASTNSGLDTSDYNNIYSAGTDIAYWSGSRATLADLQSTSGFESNSVSVDPQYRSDMDLHTKTTGLDGKGTPLTAVTVDIDGDSRNATTPDIGADEFTPLTNDLAMSDIFMSTLETCTQTNASIDLAVSNVGTSSQTGFDIYAVLNGTSYSTNYSSSLASGATDTVTITGINLSQAGNYGVTAYAVLTGEQDASDDTLSTTDSVAVALSPNAPTAQNDTVCEGGSGLLTANSTAQAHRWFLAATPDSAIYTGDSLSLSGITSTTSYEVEGYNFNSEQVGATSVPTSSFITTSVYGLGFDVNVPEVVIDTVTMYPTGTGWFIVHVSDYSGNPLYSSDTIRVTGASLTKTRVPVGVTVPSGSYKMTMTYDGITDMGREFGLNFPYTSNSGAVEIVGGSTGTGNPTSTSYYWFYDWSITVPGCPSPRTTATLAIDSLPTAIVTNDTAICAGDKTTIIAQTNASNTVVWNGSVTNNQLTVDTAGAYVASITGTNGCSIEDTVNLTVNSLPTLTVNNDTTICDGNSVTLSAQTNASNIVWNGTVSAVALTADTSGFYVAVATDNNSCSVSDTVILGVLPLPQVDLGADTSFCSHDSVTFDAGSGAVLYTWSNNTNAQTVTVSNAGTYWVRYTDQNGCVGTDTVVASTITPVQPDLTDISDVCADASSFNLTGGSPAGGVYTVNGNIATSFDPTVEGAGVYNVTYRTTDANGCIGDSTVTFSVNALPNVSLMPFDTLCENDAAISLTGGMPTGGNYTVDGSSATNFDPSQGPATYSVVYEYTDNNNCTNDATESIVVNAAPVVDLGDNIEICGDAEATLDAGTQDMYSWSTGDSTQSITVQTSGTYDVTVTNNDGCSSTSSVNVSYEAVCVGVDEQLAENTDVVYYPNPATSAVQLDATGFSGDVRLSVADLNGRVLYEATVEGDNKVYNHNIDVSTFEAGVYLFQLESDAGVVTHRVTVSR